MNCPKKTEMRTNMLVEHFMEQNEEIKVANYSIVKFEDVVSTVEEFFETLQLPKCIEWEEL